MREDQMSKNAESIDQMKEPDLSHFPDHDMQLKAIHGLSHTLHSWNQKFSKEAETAYASKPESDHEIDMAIDAGYFAGFSHLAAGHAFICTIAAYLESLFELSLPLAGRNFEAELDSSNPRVARFVKSPESFWNPKKPKFDGTGFPHRVVEILRVSGFGRHFGRDFERVFSALFEYRNKMVHNGYEWSPQTGKKFETRTRQEGWVDWFSVHKSQESSWNVTITPDFRSRCLECCDRSVFAFEGLIRRDWEPYNARFGRDVQDE